MEVKTKFNALVDLFIGITFLIAAASALVLFFLLPKGLRGSEFILSRHTWGELHDISGLLMIIGVIIHLLLHTSYIKNIFNILKGGGKNDK